MICGFTGHRPQKLPWGTREEDPRCQALKTKLSQAIDRALELGCTHFLCGMARGCDTYFAQLLVEKRKTRPDLILEAMIPCPGQADRWPPADRQRYGTLLLAFDRCTVVEDCYSAHCMQHRNEALVDRSDLMITVYDGSGGGTGHTVAYAEKRRVPIIALWL